MIFTRLGLLVAWLALLMSAGRFALAIYAMSLPTDAAMQFSARYLGAQHPAPTLDQSAVVFGFAVALGILVEISRSLKRQEGDE